MATIGDDRLAGDGGPVAHRVAAVYHSGQDMPGVYRCSGCHQWVAKGEGRREWVHTNQELNPPPKFSLRAKLRRRAYLYR